MALRSRFRKLHLRLNKNVVYFWSAFEGCLSGSLASLIRSSHLNTISLAGAAELPFDLIRESKIQHLSLESLFFERNVNLRPNPPSSGQPKPLVLKSLSTDLKTEMTLVDFARFTGNSHQLGSTFSHLTVLALSLFDARFLHDMHQLFEMTEVLQSLQVVYKGRYDGVFIFCYRDQNSAAEKGSYQNWGTTPPSTILRCAH